MKTRIIIEVETKKMHPVYDDEDLNFAEDICEETDKEFHNAIFKFIEEIVQDSMEEKIMEDMDYYGIETITEDHNDFNDFGEINITTSQEIIDKSTTKQVR